MKEPELLRTDDFMDFVESKSVQEREGTRFPSFFTVQ
jgi:hypothetical protein